MAFFYHLINGIVDQVINGGSIPRLTEQGADFTFHLPNSFWQKFHLAMVFLYPFYDGIQHIRQITYQPGDGCIGTCGITIATSRTIVRDPLGMFKTNTGHIPEK